MINTFFAFDEGAQGDGGLTIDQRQAALRLDDAFLDPGNVAQRHKLSAIAGRRVYGNRHAADTFQRSELRVDFDHQVALVGAQKSGRHFGVARLKLLRDFGNRQP